MSKKELAEEIITAYWESRYPTPETLQVIADIPEKLRDHIVAMINLFEEALQEIDE